MKIWFGACLFATLINLANASFNLSATHNYISGGFALAAAILFGGTSILYYKKIKTANQRVDLTR